MPASSPTGDPRKARGRPSDYRPEYDEQARKLCLLLGATTDDLAQFFEVSEKTVRNWMKRHASFASAVRRGKLIADGNVVERLYSRAVGYSQKTEKVFAHPQSGSVVRVETVEVVTPDVTAGIFWLKNRQPDKWRDRARGDELPPPELQAARFLAAMRAIDDLELPADALAEVEPLEPLETAGESAA